MHDMPPGVCSEVAAQALATLRLVAAKHSAIFHQSRGLQEGVVLAAGLHLRLAQAAEAQQVRQQSIQISLLKWLPPGMPARLGACHMHNLPAIWLSPAAQSCPCVEARLQAHAAHSLCRGYHTVLSRLVHPSWAAMPRVVLQDVLLPAACRAQGSSFLWGPAMSPDAARGIGILYSELLQPSRTGQADFMRALVAHFEAACRREARSATQSVRRAPEHSTEQL